MSSHDKQKLRYVNAHINTELWMFFGAAEEDEFRKGMNGLVLLCVRFSFDGNQTVGSKQLIIFTL